METNYRQMNTAKLKLPMTDAERTMREEGWMLSNELFDPNRPEPPEVAAFRLLQEDDWAYFMMDVEDNAALRFFNPEKPEFSSATDWEHLGKIYGMEPFTSDWAIDESLADDLKCFCRDLRNHVRGRSGVATGGCKSFYAPAKWVDPLSPAVSMVVVHDGGVLAPYFNINYEDYEGFNYVDELLRRRKLWRESQNPAVTFIFRNGS